ncbi:hypothetical protein KF728_01095 [Candidatus Obscuribacterales bacterium]|nr:hypothetical protein [Candidatus Obscuribacterales bacterium]
MNNKERVERAQRMLTDHLKQTLPEARTEVSDDELVEIDSAVCNLVANLIRFDGDLQKVNEHYQEAGIQNDFNTLLLQIQNRLDQLMPNLNDLALREYFVRLSRISVVAAEIGLSQLIQINETVDLVSSSDLRQTADLDEGLREFRKRIAQTEPA